MIWEAGGVKRFEEGIDMLIGFLTIFWPGYVLGENRSFTSTFPEKISTKRYGTKSTPEKGK